MIHTADVFTNVTNTVRVESWTRLDLGARYKTSFNGRPLTLRANLENVSDTRYWVVSNYGTIGLPRTLQLSASLDFYIGPIAT